MDLLTLLVALVVLAVTLFALYWIIRSAVFAALRDHTVNSTTAVMIRGSVPLTTMSSEDKQPQQKG